MQIPKNVVQRYVLSIRHRYDAVFAVREGRALYWMSLTEVNRFRRDRDNFYYSFPSEKLVIFKKMTPCLNTGEQLEQISVKLLIYSMY